MCTCSPSARGFRRAPTRRPPDHRHHSEAPEQLAGPPRRARGFHEHLAGVISPKHGSPRSSYPPSTPILSQPSLEIELRLKGCDQALCQSALLLVSPYEFVVNQVVALGHGVVMQQVDAA